MRVRVWKLDLDQPASTVADLARHLDPYETRSAAARSDSRTRDRYVVAHGAVREILAGVAGAEPAALQIDRRCAHCGDAAHGKPALGDVRELSFNVSHSGSVALVAVARNSCVGVDVEVIRSRRHLEKLATRVLSSDEYDAWRVVAPAARSTEFLRSWTAKEAYLKAIGVGLVRPLRSVPVRPEGWSVWAVDAGPAVVACVAVEGVGAAHDRPPSVAPWVPGRGVTLGAEW
jgi:4'-phosphopantetheinyl transferase